MDSFKSFMKRIKWEALLAAIFAIVIGALFIVYPENSGNVLCYVGGGLFIALGMAMLVAYFTAGLLFGSYFFIISMILFLVGIVCVACPEIVKGFITVIFGIFLVADGVTKLQLGIDGVKVGIKGSWSLFIVAAASIALGITVTFGTFEDVMLFAGISLIIDGISDIITTLVFSAKYQNATRNVKRVLKNVKSDADDVIEGTVDKDE